MLFNTLSFLLVFSLFFVSYWAIPDKHQAIRKAYLLMVSYVLYAFFNPAFTLVLLGVTFVTYWGGRLFSGNHKTGGGRLVWAFLVLAFLPLLVFKYYNFINTNVVAFLSLFGCSSPLPGLNWAIPVGISFFSFQAVGYMLDVYFGRVKAERNLIDYMLFVSFFPQIASGPISKASELLPQIKDARHFDYCQAVSGLRYLLWGMFLKVALADRVGIYVDTVFSEFEKFSGPGCMIGSLMYSIQIYADFAGYSFMAVGLGKLLGFNLINNFHRPYFSLSVTDFWRRWHISLSRWLKDYVYIPMGGNRCSRARNYWNIFVTFLVSGVWHGANWTFIVWGGLHGICQILEKHFGWNKLDSRGVVKAIRICITFVIVTIAWAIFRSPSIEEAWGFLAQFLVFSGKMLAEGSVFVYSIMALIPLLAFDVLCEFFPCFYQCLYGNTIVRWFVYIMLFSMILLMGVYDGSSFIYVSF